MQQKQIKTEVAQLIQHNHSFKNITLIKIKTAELAVNKGIFENQELSEINYKGKLFDIVYQKKVGSLVYLYCVNDKKEEQLIAELNKQINQNGNAKSTNKTAKDFRKNIVKDYFHSPIEISFYTSSVLPSNHTVFYSLSSISMEILAPPPKVFC